jgi:glutamyl/glutaminyl-tRNA synthetase
MKYALQLIEQGDAYYCFCPEAKTDLDTYKEECNYTVGLRI